MIQQTKDIEVLYPISQLSIHNKLSKERKRNLFMSHHFSLMFLYDILLDFNEIKKLFFTVANSKQRVLSSLSILCTTHAREPLLTFISFFRPGAVFTSATYLIYQTNQVMITVKKQCEQNGMNSILQKVCRGLKRRPRKTNKN